MSLSQKQRALVHIARKQLGLSDEKYRDVLSRVAGVRTSKDLNSSSLSALLDHFRSLGWDSYPVNRAPAVAASRSLGERSGMASPEQVNFILSLWGQYVGADAATGARIGRTERALGKWLERWFKISDIRFLPADDAPRVIEALKVMAARRGDG